MKPLKFRVQLQPMKINTNSNYCKMSVVLILWSAEFPFVRPELFTGHHKISHQDNIVNNTSSQSTLKNNTIPTN